MRSSATSSRNVTRYNNPKRARPWASSNSSIPVKEQPSHATHTMSSRHLTYDGDRGLCATQMRKKMGLFLRSACVIGMGSQPIRRSTIPLNSCRVGADSFYQVGLLRSGTIHRSPKAFAGSLDVSALNLGKLASPENFSPDVFWKGSQRPQVAPRTG